MQVQEKVQRGSNLVRMFLDDKEIGDLDFRKIIRLAVPLDADRCNEVGVVGSLKESARYRIPGVPKMATSIESVQVMGNLLIVGISGLHPRARGRAVIKEIALALKAKHGSNMPVSFFSATPADTMTNTVFIAYSLEGGKVESLLRFNDDGRCLKNVRVISDRQILFSDGHELMQADLRSFLSAKRLSAKMLFHAPAEIKSLGKLSLEYGRVYLPITFEGGFAWKWDVLAGKFPEKNDIFTPFSQCVTHVIGRIREDRMPCRGAMPVISSTHAAVFGDSLEIKQISNY